MRRQAKHYDDVCTNLQAGWKCITAGSRCDDDNPICVTPRVSASYGDRNERISHTTSETRKHHCCQPQEMSKNCSHPLRVD